MSYHQKRYRLRLIDIGMSMLSAGKSVYAALLLYSLTSKTKVFPPYFFASSINGYSSYFHLLGIFPINFTGIHSDKSIIFCIHFNFQED